MRSLNSKKFINFLKKFGFKKKEHQGPKKHTVYERNGFEIHLSNHNKEVRIEHYKDIFEKIGIPSDNINRLFNDKDYRKRKIKEFKEKTKSK